MLKKLFEKLFPPKIEIVHPLFGTLLFFPSSRKGSISYWEGTIKDPFFEDNNIGLLIDGDQSGPSPKQIEFFKNLFSNKNIIPEMVLEKLKPRFVEWTKAPFPTDFFSEFTISGLSIPTEGDLKQVWDISFDSKTDPNHLFTVYFENGVPINITIDG